MYADTQDEINEWVDVLNSVRGKPAEEIARMVEVARVNPRHAQGTIEVDDILSVGPTNTTDVDGHPTFAVMTSDQVLKFVALHQANLEDWCSYLAPKKRMAGQGGEEGEALERGWMIKSGGKGMARRRWFVLRGDVISYYKQKADDYALGSIPLNSLSSVLAPDEEQMAHNDWTFTIHSKHKTFYLECKTQADCERWVSAIQDVIDNSPVAETPTEFLMDELKLANGPEVEQIYASHKVLTYSAEPLRASLLPLMYGVVGPVGSSGRTYDTLAKEALKISASLLMPDPSRGLQRYGSPSDPTDLIKNVLQVCFDVPQLRNEVYCQVIKQTTNATNPGNPLNLTHWHLLAALCCSFAPARKFVRFLRLHLRRTMELGDTVGEEVAAVAAFCLEANKRTKARDFPPSTREIEAIMSGKGLTCMVSCVDGTLVELPVTSSTTCGEVIVFVKKELGLVQCRNGFGLFENCGHVDKYLEEKYTVADILSKWEKYEQHGINPDGGSWKLVFKLFSFYEPMANDLSNTEKDFMYEQAFASVMQGKFPASDELHLQLAALREQYIVGDYIDGAYISDLVKVHPAQREQLLAQEGSGGTGTLRKAKTMLKGTLRGLGNATLRRLKGGTMKKVGVVSDAELAKIKENIVQCWKGLVVSGPARARCVVTASLARSLAPNACSASAFSAKTDDHGFLQSHPLSMCCGPSFCSLDSAWRYAGNGHGGGPRCLHEDYQGLGRLRQQPL